MTATQASLAYWERVRESGFDVPGDRSLPDLTVELVDLLGVPDAHVRTEVACEVLSTWVRRGVYDDLLTGLGDGMCTGLLVGRGERGTDTVLRRSYSARALTAVVERDNAAWLLHPDTVLRWGDRGLAWLLEERDLRGYVDGLGWADAVGHGADLLAALAMSRHIDEGALRVLLDALGDRVLTPTTYPLVNGEDDRLAYGAMAILHRNTLGMDTLGPWLERLGQGWQAPGRTPVPAQALNTRAFLRALHLHLRLGIRGMPDKGDATHFFADVELRDDLLRVLERVLRRGHPFFRQIGR
ncbi:MAG: DUF2785 domain-containing protein [Actinomycetes bacterium]